MNNKFCKKTPHRVGYKPRRVRGAPEKDPFWTYTAGALALWPTAYHQMDHEFEGFVEHNPAPGAPIVCIPQPDIVADKILKVQALSNEAKYVLDLIFNAPYEVLQLITTPKKKDITIPRITTYLRKFMGWETKQVAHTLAEIQTYVDNL